MRVHNPRIYEHILKISATEEYASLVDIKSMQAITRMSFKSGHESDRLCTKIDNTVKYLHTIYNITQLRTRLDCFRARLDCLTKPSDISHLTKSG